MWILELIAGFFGATVGTHGPHIGGDNSPMQNVVMGIGEIALPILGFALVIWAGLLEHPDLALIWMPVAFTAMTALLAMRLVGDSGWTVKATLLAGVANWTGCAAAYLVAGFVGFYSTF